MGQGNQQGGDSLQHRTYAEDSISILQYFLDSSRGYKFDSSTLNISRRFPIPPNYVYLGNLGAAARPILFSPAMRAGWDYGFHAYDLYRFSPEQMRFFNTTRPYTELGYMLGTQLQQVIEVLHTQNIKPNWNASFQYRLINAPGFFKNQLANHSNVSLTSWYQSNNKRYNNYLILLGNKSTVNENGGLVDPALLSTTYASRQEAAPVRMGDDVNNIRNFFSSALNAGNRYNETVYMMRQQYDFGRKDSVVTDSTVIPLFYPRVRFENTTSFSKNLFSFEDKTVPGSNAHDPRKDTSFLLAAYPPAYGDSLATQDSLQLRDSWRELKTDFSIYTFPEIKNQQQFLKLGAMYQHLSGTVATGSVSYYNVMVHGEYRNRTRNQKWDMLAYGHLYLTGYNSGDYHGYVSLQRSLGKRVGSLLVGFENVNRTAPYSYNVNSSFYLDPVAKTFNKENTAHFFASINDPALRLQLTGDYFVINNYLYLTNYYSLQQETSLFTVLRLGAQKAFRLSRHFNLYSELYLQQKTGNVPVNFPTVYTRNRLAFEGVFFRNLNLSTGFELRYHTPYKADNYSPLRGQFFYQNNVTINNFPEVDAFLNFRIRTFKAYVRIENLNSANVTSQGFSFSNNNFAAPAYPMPGLVFRLGINWAFIN
jgi:hypothetical protein